VARVDALMRSGFTRSFEFFPPKDDQETATLDQTLADLAPLRPDFVSVTYRGGRISRQRTFDLVSRIQREFSLPAMAHLICVCHTRAEVREILANYQRDGVENLMALGGDPSTDPDAHPGEFGHALELVELARECGDFAIGVAAHPLGHPRSIDLDSDRLHLAAKLRLADFAVTQFFFEADNWSSLVDDLSSRGIDKPVLPGILPLTSLSSIPRMADMGGVVPAALVERLHRAHDLGGARAVREEGVSAAAELCTTLIERGAPGIHLFTMNRSAAAVEVWRSLW
jgi:methylenetetrahydrofolate reductase (NADPH)